MAEQVGKRQQPMKRYAIRYARVPTNYNDTRVAVVEAETPEIALELLKHQLGDHSGVWNYAYSTPEEYVPPVSNGRVLTLNEEVKE